ncbi:TPA: Arc family DNA-binding protein [Klebsiella pneumoniae]|nr:Arc family DNA-binding protein [Klebsiella pneumoniae]HCD3712172.1 Arc family DNA-binding protein [Klebsiella pneumoniae]HCD4732127.1 Arc family DNA-binding protein [Klebsiella pneumoniae]HCD6823611.1 Arc family DNA-binding protein [Klebsiella pneumoniae]HCH6762195.1 Arc family DNA-binding protein [Klebsiella pneumoniae]
MTKRPYKNPQVNLRLPQELKDRVASLAELKGRSANSEMVDAISFWVEREERLQIELMARRRDFMLPHKFNSAEEEIEYLKSLFNGNESKKPT